MSVHLIPISCIVIKIFRSPTKLREVNGDAPSFRNSFLPAFLKKFHDYAFMNCGSNLSSTFDPVTSMNLLISAKARRLLCKILYQIMMCLCAIIKLFQLFVSLKLRQGTSIYIYCYYCDYPLVFVVAIIIRVNWHFSKTIALKFRLNRFNLYRDQKRTSYNVIKFHLSWATAAAAAAATRKAENNVPNWASYAL